MGSITTILDVANAMEKVGCCPLTSDIIVGDMFHLAGIFDNRGGRDLRKVVLSGDFQIYAGQILVAGIGASGFEIGLSSLLSDNSIDSVINSSGTMARIVVAPTAYYPAGYSSILPAARKNSHGQMHFNGGIIGNNMAKVMKFFDPSLAGSPLLRADSADLTVHHLSDKMIHALRLSGFVVDGKANRI